MHAYCTSATLRKLLKFSFYMGERWKIIQPNNFLNVEYCFRIGTFFSLQKIWIEKLFSFESFLIEKMKEKIHIGLSVVGKWWFGYLRISATLDMSNRWQEPYVSSCHWCGRFFVHLSLVCLSCCLEAYASVIYQTSHSAQKYMQTECNATQTHWQHIQTVRMASTMEKLRFMVNARVSSYIEKIAQQYRTGYTQAT